MRGVIAVAFLVACAPTVDGPAERARVADREDGARLTQALHDLPGVVAIHPELHHAIRDPFTNSETRANALVLVLVDDQADKTSIRNTTARLVHAAMPEVTSPEILIEVGEHRMTMARVGPFTVDARTKARLVGVLVTALATIAALAGYLAWRTRRPTAW
jgi:hypothetical protein